MTRPQPIDIADYVKGKSASVLAIDPGSEQSAMVYLKSGAVFAHFCVPNQVLLRNLRDMNTAIEYDDVPLYIEMIASYGMPVGREVFETCVWIGRFQEAWGGDATKVYRQDVKLRLCKSVRATDATIRAALIDRFGPGKERAIGTKKKQGPLYGIKGDEWAALAVAVTASDLVIEPSGGAK